MQRVERVEELFLQLVAAFHEPNSGTVTVDGIDLSTVRLDSFRTQLGVVLQDTFLFDGTIEENIAFAKPGATKEQILETYLNQIYFGQGSYGVASAAQSYFGKEIGKLTLAESAFLGGLPKSHSAMPSIAGASVGFAAVSTRSSPAIAASSSAYMPLHNKTTKNAVNIFVDIGIPLNGITRWGGVNLRLQS